MMRSVLFALLFLIVTVMSAPSQESGTLATESQDLPSANPGRPTVSTPATLIPVGYLQFETGYLGAWTSPGLSSQSSVNEVVKFSVAPRLEFLVGYEPWAYSTLATQSANDQGGVSLGVQGVLLRSEGARPTIALSYFRSVYGGNTPD